MRIGLIEREIEDAIAAINSMQEFDEAEEVKKIPHMMESIGYENHGRKTIKIYKGSQGDIGTLFTGTNGLMYSTVFIVNHSKRGTMRIFVKKKRAYNGKIQYEWDWLNNMDLRWCPASMCYYKLIGIIDNSNVVHADRFTEFCIDNNFNIKSDEISRYEDETENFTRRTIVGNREGEIKTKLKYTEDTYIGSQYTEDNRYRAKLNLSINDGYIKQLNINATELGLVVVEELMGYYEKMAKIDRVFA